MDHPHFPGADTPSAPVLCEPDCTTPEREVQTIDALPALQETPTAPLAPLNCPRASRICRSARGWRELRSAQPMPRNRGTTLAATTASIAVVLTLVLATAYGLLALERRLEGGAVRAQMHALLGIRTAYAATVEAPILIRSHQMPVTTPAGSVIELTLGFKNASEFVWRRGTGSHVLLERRDAVGPSAFIAANWIDTMRAAGQSEEAIAPGALALFTARFQTPIEPRTSTEWFVLRTLDGRTLAGSATEIVIVATPPDGTVAQSLNPFATAPTAADAAGTDGTDPFFIADLPLYDEEPIIRVGITYREPTDAAWNPHRITADGPFRVESESGKELLRLTAGDTIGIDFRPSTGTYHLHHNEVWTSNTGPLRVIPDAPTTTLMLTTYTKPLAWEGNTADNRFRGILEVRYVPHTKRLWVVNELDIEDYLRGLTETSDGAPAEFQKAQAVAARTFALYHIRRGGKYPKGEFILRNDARDQVYRGENAAARRPNLVAAVEATRGIVVTHGGSVVITPYFAQSNGQTRAWTDTWGGAPRAWLTSVADPTCAGKRQIGHGVGLAQRCAMTLADQGWSWQAILRHYYQGIQLAKVYE